MSSVLVALGRTGLIDQVLARNDGELYSALTNFDPTRKARLESLVP